MPQLKWSRAVLTGASDSPISAQIPPWQYEFLPWPAEVVLMQRSTLVSGLESVFSGSETIAQEQPINGVVFSGEGVVPAVPPAWVGCAWAIVSEPQETLSRPLTSGDPCMKPTPAGHGRDS